MKIAFPPLPFNGGLALMIKTILRDGGYIEAGFRRIVPRNGSGTTEPIGDFREVCKKMSERGEIVQYKPLKDIGASYVWGMKGITPDICKDRDELFTQLELLTHRVERLKAPRWVSMHRHKPQDRQRILAFVPLLANKGAVGQVVGRYDAAGALVTVSVMTPQPSGTVRLHVVQYEFSHWMPQHSDPTD